MIGRLAREGRDLQAVGEAKRQRMLHATHHEFVSRIVEAVEVLANQGSRAQELGIFELGELGIVLCDEQRIALRKRGDERRRNGQTLLSAMTGAAGAAVSAESFIEEELSAASHEWIGRLDVVGEGSGDGVEALALAKAEQAFLEQGAIADGDT